MILYQFKFWKALLYLGWFKVSILCPNIPVCLLWILLKIRSIRILDTIVCSGHCFGCSLLHGTPLKSSQNVFTCPFVVINLNDLGTIKNIGCRAVAHILGDEGWKQLFACLNFGIFNWPKWIYVPHSLSTRNLEADKAFITSWSGDIFQVRVQVRAPAGHLAIRLSRDNWSFWLLQSQWPSSCCSALAHLPFCMVLSQSVHL